MRVAAGWNFEPALRHGHPNPCDFFEAQQLADSTAGSRKWVEDTGRVYMPPDPPLPRSCDACDRPCTAECRCGETYCDKDCQAADWHDHRHICDICEDNHSLGMKLNARVWGNLGVDAE
tara:strand:+ start:37 stop:393 length:357 start_codon:yes stop_codon:yes gene_type:complete